MALSNNGYPLQGGITSTKRPREPKPRDSTPGTTQRKRATDQRRGNKRSKLSEAQSGTVEGILLSSMLTGEPSTIRHPENNKSGDGGPTKNTPADDACDDDIGLGSESESCDDDVDNKMAVNRGAAGELANKERFEKLVRSLVVPREMESPFTHYSGLSGTTRSVQQQEFETTTKNEKGKPLSRSTMDLYTTYMNLFKRFCDDKYSEQGAFRYDVTPSKAGLFFEEVMFHRTTKKYFFKKQFKDVRIPVCLPAGFKDLVHMNRVDLADVLKDIEEDEKGRKVVVIPCGQKSMDMALCALTYLQKRQANRLISPNSSKEIRTVTQLQSAIDHYCRNLVIGVLQHEQDLSSDCMIRNSYTEEEHLRILLDTWGQPLGTQTPWIREHFALAIRHAMLLRDEDLRKLNLSDCFVDLIQNRMGGTQAVAMLVFAIHRGKTNQTGKTLHGAAVRHEDVRRCSVGAFAFYMFDRFQNKGEPPPDLNNRQWLHFKVLRGTNLDTTAPVSYAATRESTLRTFERQELSCAHVTHSGRHSGAMEGQRMQVPLEDIRRAGRWVHGNGKLENYYLTEYPTNFAFAIAGFKEKPFHLKRNEVSPSLDLQRTVFPFIENAFDKDGVKDQRWRKECEMEMMEFNPNEKKQLRDIKPLTPLFKTHEKAPVRMTNTTRTKKCYLRVLLRMRRVVLQDAAEYLAEYPYLHSPLLKNVLFKTQEFREFKDLVKARLDVKERAMQDDVPPNLMRLITNQREDISEERTRFERIIATMAEERRLLLEDQQEMWQGFQAQLASLTSLVSSLQPSVRSMSPSVAPQWAPRGLRSPGFPYPPHPHPHAPAIGMATSCRTCSAISGPMNSSTMRATPTSVGPTRITQMSLPSSSAAKTSSVLPSRTYVEIAPHPEQGISDSENAEGYFILSYFHQSAEDVYKEYIRYREYRTKRKRQGRPEDILPKTRKQLSNRKFIVMEIEHLQRQGARRGLTNEQALKEAFSQLTNSMTGGSHRKKKKLSINQMVEYCRGRAKERESGGSEGQEPITQDRDVVEGDKEEEEEGDAVEGDEEEEEEVEEMQREKEVEQADAEEEEEELLLRRRRRR